MPTVLSNVRFGAGSYLLILSSSQFDPIRSASGKLAKNRRWKSPTGKVFSQPPRPRVMHEALPASNNLIPADAYFGRGQTVLLERERIKRKTIANRRLLHRTQAA